jgi:hypothetical protein
LAQPCVVCQELYLIKCRVNRGFFGFSGIKLLSRSLFGNYTHVTGRRMSEGNLGNIPLTSLHTVSQNKKRNPALRKKHGFLYSLTSLFIRDLFLQSYLDVNRRETLINKLRLLDFIEKNGCIVLHAELALMVVI